MERESLLTGILVINKPKSLTSRDVVNRVSKLLHTKKIGHTGTLDPIATGVLILTIGKCTKLSEFLTSTFKEYEATFVLGSETDTLDNTGIVLKTSDIAVDDETITSCIKSFEGSYDQTVPAYSAVKIEGRRLYDYARNGEEVELPKRYVTISSIDILSIDKRTIKIRTTVSKGTYIRSLIRDIGRALKTYATMTDLVRTKQGNVDIKNSYTLEEVECGAYKILTPAEILADIPTVEMDDELFFKVSNGRKIELSMDEEYVKFVYKNEVIALYKKDDTAYRMYVKF